jgi:nucleoside-diphosphate-sugar epimerase
MDALVVGGTRFIGPPTVEDLLDNGYDVTIFNRGNHANPFADRDRVSHHAGDRTERADLEAVRDAVEPDVVVDLVAYHPADVREAVDIFADVDAYVYVSSGAAYRTPAIPLLEGETRLFDCTEEQATDDSMESYGPRKAEGDRIVFEAADRGVNAMSVRPPVVYGPGDYTERLDYWIHRVATYDEILVPGDGTNVYHRGFVDDVARALRIVAERGEPGEAYNVADRQAVTLGRTVHRIGEALDTEVETVFASDRELATADLSLDDFPLYIPWPTVFDTDKLADLGWESTPLAESMAVTVEEHLESDRDGRELGPSRDRETDVIDALR